MQGDFITSIKSAYNQFTKAEKKVADYILANPRDVLFMSITDLAEACEVGDTSVFRFCKTMDLKGYQEFKMMLSLSISKGQEQVDQFTGNNISMEDSFGELSRKVLNTNINALNETFSMIKEEDIDRAITLIHRARRVFFFGVGASMLTAMKAMNKFMRIETRYFVYRTAICRPWLRLLWMSGIQQLFFLFRSNQGYHPCGRGSEAVRRQDYLYYPFCEITSERLFGCHPFIRSQ